MRPQVDEFPKRRTILVGLDGRPLVDAKTYALERAHDLLSAALRDDAKRGWWQSPNRLWVGRVDHALTLIRHALGDE